MSAATERVQLDIRTFPAELKARIASAAVRRGVSFTDFCKMILVDYALNELKTVPGD